LNTHGTGTSPRLVVAGNANVDLILGPVAPWPRPGTEVLVSESAWRVGGALGNTALALAGLGVAAELVWDVGDDAMGTWLATEVGGTTPRRLPAPTSVTVALSHPDGERTFVSHLGHLAASTPDALERTTARVASGDVVFVGGSFLLPRWRPALAELFARARAQGARTALDTGWPTDGWTAANRAELLDLLAHVDVFLPNHEEARGVLDAPDATLDELLERLDGAVAGRCLVKLGADGAAWREAGRVVRAAAPAVEVVDTVGAGDTFNAALLAGFRDHLPWSGTVDAAVRAASLAISTRPRRYPSWSDLSVPAPA
jgi:sugar/nucleoside kinase (ribokinase family)